MLKMCPAHSYSNVGHSSSVALISMAPLPVVTHKTFSEEPDGKAVLHPDGDPLISMLRQG